MTYLQIHFPRSLLLLIVAVHSDGTCVALSEDTRVSKLKHIQRVRLSPFPERRKELVVSSESSQESGPKLDAVLSEQLQNGDVSLFPRHTSTTHQCGTLGLNGKSHSNPKCCLPASYGSFWRRRLLRLEGGRPELSGLSPMHIGFFLCLEDGSMVNPFMVRCSIARSVSCFPNRARLF